MPLLQPGTVLCRIDDIEEPGAKGFSFGSGRERIALFVVRHAEGISLFVNECPHAYTTLDFPEDRFLTHDGSEILCGTHGARFTLKDGLCIAGPCSGRRLKRLPLRLDDDKVVLA